MQVRMQIIPPIISEDEDGAIVILREVNGKRQFPILIGIFEAAGIDQQSKKRRKLRRLRQPPLGRAIEELGGVPERVVVDDLQDSTLSSTIYILQGERTFQFNCEPSEAVVLAIDENVPVFVEEEVLKQLLTASSRV